MARCVLEIDRQAIARNFKKIVGHTAADHTMAVIKADAYGLGALEIAGILKNAGCSAFGVADVNEASKIKDIDRPIFILGDVFDDELSKAFEIGAVIPLSRKATAEKLNQLALQSGCRHPIHFNIDTGMGRLGLLESEAIEFIRYCSKLPGLYFYGIYSHFPHAFGDEDFSALQVQRFKNLIRQLDNLDIQFEYRHIANSDGIQNIPNSYSAPFNMVRTGINLYGCFDYEGRQSLSLENVVKLKTRLISTRVLKAGSSIGYGRTYKLNEEKRIGTIAIGYADGFPITLQGKAHVYIGGVKCPLVGRVSMDYITVDLSGAVQAKVGDEVVCLGEGMDIEQWASWSGSIAYDILCSIGKRVQRRYL